MFRLCMAVSWSVGAMRLCMASSSVVVSVRLRRFGASPLSVFAACAKCCRIVEILAMEASFWLRAIFCAMLVAKASQAQLKESRLCPSFWSFLVFQAFVTLVTALLLAEIAPWCAIVHSWLLLRSLVNHG